MRVIVKLYWHKYNLTFYPDGMTHHKNSFLQSKENKLIKDGLDYRLKDLDNNNSYRYNNVLSVLFCKIKINTHTLRG